MRDRNVVWGACRDRVCGGLCGLGDLYVVLMVGMKMLICVGCGIDRAGAR